MNEKIEGILGPERHSLRRDGSREGLDRHSQETKHNTPHFVYGVFLFVVFVFVFCFFEGLHRHSRVLPA